MTDAEYHLAAERDELRRQVEGLRAERERWRQIPTPLTDAEREAVAFAANRMLSSYVEEREVALTLRGLLARCATSTRERGE